MIHRIAILKSNWHNRSSVCSPFTFSKKAITKKFFDKTFGYFFQSSRHKLYFLQTCGYFFKGNRPKALFFCKPAVTISKVIDRMLYFLQNALLPAKCFTFYNNALLSHSCFIFLLNALFLVKMLYLLQNALFSAKDALFFFVIALLHAKITLFS